MTGLAWAGLILAMLYAVMTGFNLVLFRGPRQRSDDETPPSVSLLIPARDEAERIGATLHAALASRGVDLEICVLDDGSTDATAESVTDVAARDPRVRLIRGAPLPAGWNGKQHACTQLADAARHDTFVFIDADVDLGPDALARTVGALHDRKLGLISGFPRESTSTSGERLLVPMIGVLLLGYLPLALSRLLSRTPAFAAGCGQLMAVTRAAYVAAGGHRAIARCMHDGLRLPANVRRAGYATDICNAATIANCRMYDGFASAWRGFSKDATEGMATPIGLPIWTILLAGGHLLPWLTLVAGWASGSIETIRISACALIGLSIARLFLARVCRQHVRAVLLHPAAVACVLALQWRARWAAWLGQPRVWRGRRYH